MPTRRCKSGCAEYFPASCGRGTIASRAFPDPIYMLSYRHAFHAGNHADVLKHFVELELLHYLAQKDKPYWYIDTHAGAGCYALDSEYAEKNAEFESGIARLWEADDLPATLADYVDMVRHFNPDGRLKLYPGSPWSHCSHARAGPDAAV